MKPTRYIDWDVDGLAVWCDACRNDKHRCDACQDAYELEDLWNRCEGDPYHTGPMPSQPRPEGKR